MTLPTFIDTRLDEDIEQGAQGGPSFLTTVMELAGGKEKRNIEWSLPRQEWDISYGIQSPQDLQQVKSMFYLTFGRAIGFRFKDWSDYQIGDPVNYVPANAQLIAVADGTVGPFQIVKAYTVSPYTFNRKVTRPVAGTLSVYDGLTLKTETTDYTVNYDTGQITFVSGHQPANTHNINVSCEFDVPVRFDSDYFKKKVTWTGAEELPTIAIKELKE